MGKRSNSSCPLNGSRKIPQIFFVMDVDICTITYLAFIRTKSTDDADWATNIADRAPLIGSAEDGTAYNSNLPDGTEGWW